MKRSQVSRAVIRRLPRYYRHLDSLYKAGVGRISSRDLGEALGLTASQIRQDLSCFGEFGQQGYGYNVETLREEVSLILGMDQGHTAVIMGAGNLGRALIENFRFSQHGFRLLAAFDVHPDVVGSKIGDIPILHTNQLEELAARRPIDVGVLTVPKDAAVKTAERFVRLGVRGIWNFTNMDLAISDPSIVVENVHFGDSLLALSYMITKE